MQQVDKFTVVEKVFRTLSNYGLYNDMTVHITKLTEDEVSYTMDRPLKNKTYNLFLYLRKRPKHLFYGDLDTNKKLDEELRFLSEIEIIR